MNEQLRNYQVNYTISVEATQGVEEVTKFGKAVGKLIGVKEQLNSTTTAIANMMQKIDAIFRSENGKTREYNYKLRIETGETETRLKGVADLLTQIDALTKDIKLVIHTEDVVGGNDIKAKAQKLVDKKVLDTRKEMAERQAASTILSVTDMQKRITKAIGKINGALVSLERGREVNIQTDTSVERLQGILSLLNQIKSASKITVEMKINSYGDFMSETGLLYTLEKRASSTLSSVEVMQKQITKVVGKINAALISLERGHEVNVRTDVAKERLQEVFMLLNQIKRASKIAVEMRMGSYKDSGNEGGMSSVPQKRATSILSSVTGIQQQITKVVGKIKGALVSLEHGREVKIRSNAVKERLHEILSLLNQIQGASKITVEMRMGSYGEFGSETGMRSILEKQAISALSSVRDMQQQITRLIEKTNAALISLEHGREVNIQTDVAKERLQEILSLLNQIKGASKMTLGMQMGSPGNYVSGVVVPNSPPSLSPEKMQQLLQEGPTPQNIEQLTGEFMETMRQYNRLKVAEKEEKAAERVRREKTAKEKQRQQTARESIQLMQKETATVETLNRSKQRAAINRLQYSRTPSLRNLPLAGMLNVYMGYSLMRSELTKAIEYSNIMESAHSILRVADNDLSSFETRFDQMGRRVRQIGVDTKFSAVEIAGAVKYLSMAGMSIDAINKSIRPITNLALIGDNDVSYIADLTTNIMAGYDIRNESMNSVADVIASTVSRSNVNIVEIAESYKMAAGYLRMAGVNFSESSAAIGLLGNMGLKGTLAGTSLRAMSTRFAKPTREGQKVLDRLGVKFTQMYDIYGKQVERLRSIADIFQDLHDKKATMSDMQAIFGKIGGNAGMIFLNEYDKLRKLAAENRASYGISSEFAKVKQETTKGLWAQVTSQLTESFMSGYEILEPVIRDTLRSFLDKFKAPEFTKGLVSIGQALLDIMEVLGNIGSWFVRNYHWIEPLIFTGVISTRLFKLAGSLTNIGIALGFIGKQAATASSIELIQGLAGLKGLSKMSFASKRAIVSALNAQGVSGKGAMRKALLATGGAIGGQSIFKSLFATQVATGSSLTGAGAALSAIGTGAVVATAAVTALVGALGWVAYKTWKIKEAKDAMQEEVQRREKYLYPSIEALRNSLRETYEQALATKEAVKDVTHEKTIAQASGQSAGAFTGNWWRSFFSMATAGMSGGIGMNANDIYSPSNAYQADIRAAILTIARQKGQDRREAAYAELGKQTSVTQIKAFMQNIESLYGQTEDNLDKSLWTTDKNGKILYVKGLDEMGEATAARTFDFARYQNTVIVPEIKRFAKMYLDAMSTLQGAMEFMKEGSFNFNELKNKGFFLDKQGIWRQKILGPQATDKEREEQLANLKFVRERLIRFLSSTRSVLGGSAQAAENILKKAGFTEDLFSNEPDTNDPDPFNANRITNNGLDDGGAGGNYSGTGKLSSAAPKQVIVNISNLMSIGTIDLLKSSEGQQAEVQNLKEKLAQALIDVVHDFDASWNG